MVYPPWQDILRHRMEVTYLHSKKLTKQNRRIDPGPMWMLEEQTSTCSTFCWNVLCFLSLGWRDWKCHSKNTLLNGQLRKNNKTGSEHGVGEYSGQFYSIYSLIVIHVYNSHYTWFSKEKSGLNSHSLLSFHLFISRHFLCFILRTFLFCFHTWI